MAVAKVRGKEKPDELDRALVERFKTDDASESMMLSTFVETIYWPHAESNLRGKTLREYKSIWTRYSIAEKVGGLRVKDFRTMHGAEILEKIAVKHDVCKSTLQHVPVIPNLKRLLDAHKASAALGPDGQPMADAPIFAGTRRETMDLDKLALLVIRPALESAKIPWFRRGLASNLFQLGCDDLTVQRILRHSKVQVTREKYIKVRDEKAESAMAQLEVANESASKNGQLVQ